MSEQITEPSAKPVLTGRVPNQVEDALRLRLRKYAYTRCKPEMAIFSKCSSDKTISVIYSCRDEQTALYNCINEVASDKNYEILKQSYLRGDLYRKKSHAEYSAELERRMAERELQKRNNA